MFELGDPNRLCHMIKAGNEDAFHELYLNMAEPMYRFLVRKTGSESTAEDLVQDLFVRIWKQRKRLDPNQSLKAYLYTAATRLAIDHLRRHSVRKEVGVDEIEVGFDVGNQELNVIHQQQVRDALAGLSNQQRTVFWLSRVEGLTYPEIADCLSMSVKTVETHMSRAFVKLREHLKNHTLFFLLFVWGWPW
ncbi:MAG: RNA polymerase sigma factor [Acidobacteria bacterium]|nr:RNA polymerase sigma factor [Acidobacteriota bacterium]